MAKTRGNRKELSRLKKKQAFNQATEVRLLAEQLPNQEALRTMLMQVPDPLKRKQYFEFMKPFLKFPNPTFPSTIISPGLIIP